jgi:hypothetical protein
MPIFSYTYIHIYIYIYIYIDIKIMLYWIYSHEYVNPPKWFSSMNLYTIIINQLMARKTKNNLE